MTPAQEIVLNKALQMLAASGVKYAIRKDDGTTLGNLEVVPERDQNAIRRPKVYNWVESHSYQKILDRMEVNSTHQFTVDADGMAQKLQKPVCAYASKIWGGGNYITTVHADNRTLEVLRFA